jgi:UDP-N-acetylglucosamine diphosphorylase / glucose-1-phosphate thymidylyltransferase / UDP-N-acetylgalactosamine diphosphorylase / glucosamine-1-phosphate N-acetyltransferase / galactosamine-1-phosphate N-acetyltransferase
MNKIVTLEELIEFSDFPFPDIFKEVNLWDPIKNLEQFIKACFEKGIIKANYKNSTNIYLGEGTVVKEGALIDGPAIIGKNCVIGHASLLRENCLLGNGVNIGHGVEVKSSIFLNNSTAAHLNYVGDSIVGNNVNIAGGVIVANFRLDKKSIKIKFEETVVDTGLLKFGAVIGDNSSAGANSVLNPGTILGKNSLIYPLSSVTGVHKEGETIKGAA